MGLVLAARHRDMERAVALKVLLPELAFDPSYRNRFLREIRVLARLDSPHVVRVFDAGEHDGLLYMAMELLPDGDLARLLAARGPLPVGGAVHLVGQVARGLSAAHEAGVLHRDIKPSNVLIRSTPTGPEAVLCDLGIAVAEDVDQTLTRGLIGTPAYLAPERHEGAPATVAADLYATGCLLWAALSGSAPYAGTSGQVLLGHLQGALPRLGGDTPAAHATNEVLAALLAKDPAARPASAAALVDLLSGIPDEGGAPAASLVEETVPRTVLSPSPGPPAPPAPPVVEAAHGPSPRRAGLVALGAVVVLLVVVGGAVAGFRLLRDDNPGTAAPGRGGSRVATDEADTSPAATATTAMREPTSEPPAKVAVDRRAVPVFVYNNTSITGLGGRVSQVVEQAGWTVAGADNWYGTLSESSVLYPAGLRDAAELLARDLGITRVVPAGGADVRAAALALIMTGELE